MFATILLYVGYPYDEFEEIFNNLISRKIRGRDIIKLLPTLLFTRHEMLRMNESMKEFADKVVKLQF